MEASRRRGIFPVLAILIAAGSSVALGEEYTSNEIPNLVSCYGSASTPDGALFFTVSDNAIVGVFDAVQEQYLEAIDLRDVATWTTGAAVTHGKLYVESFTHVIAIDIESHEIAAMIEQQHYLGSHFGSLAVSPDGSTVYAVVGSTTHLTAVDAETDTVAGEVEVGGDCTGLGISPSGDRLYVSDKSLGRLLIVDPGPMEIVAETSFVTEEGGFLEFPTEIAVAPDGTVYVSYVGSDFLGRVAVLDAEGGLVDTFVAESYSTGVSVTLDGEFLVLGNGDVLGTQFGEAAAHFQLPVGLSTVSLSPEGSRALITNINTQYLYTIEGFTPLLRAEGSVEVGGEITLDLRVPNDAGRMYQLLASAGVGEGIELPDGRVFPLDDDDLLRYSRDNAEENPIFHGFIGTLDESGSASATISVTQELLDLLGDGRVFYVAFATLWEPPPTKANVKTISNVIAFEIPDPPGGE